MNHLTLYNPYSREDVCRIFAPNVDFEPSRGPWGMRGIVSIPNNVGDYVFFVTFGESQANHVFKEEIDENGILSWQSQPSQDFTSSQIKEFINYDYLVNDIHLFLRRKKVQSMVGLNLIVTWDFLHFIVWMRVEKSQCILGGVC